jgi:glycosyltransferase involved in cell wall biosynthesis
MVTIIIPTCNRHSYLNDLIYLIGKQSIKPSQVIVVDSSDRILNLSTLNASEIEIEYLHTPNKSAAGQRNLGLEKVSNGCKYVAFLDDDTRPNSNYLESLIFGLEKFNAIGISGLAINPIKTERRYRPNGVVGTIQRFFLLDSERDGVILKSAIATPIRVYGDGIKQSQWLIGCSVWKYEQISKLRFENDFKGQSLGEDVIFSYRASLQGDLIVDSGVYLDHFEAKVNRPKELEFWKMWVINRYRLSKVMYPNNNVYFSFHWANLGQLLFLMYKLFSRSSQSKFSIYGIIAGYKQICFGSN